MFNYVYEGCVGFLISLVVAIGFIFLWPLFLMLLWNWVAVAVFGAVAITYWQAWGIYLIAYILIKCHPTITINNN